MKLSGTYWNIGILRFTELDESRPSREISFLRKPLPLFMGSRVTWSEVYAGEIFPSIRLTFLMNSEVISLSIPHFGIVEHNSDRR